jgi:hypothetical protein
MRYIKFYWGVCLLLSSLALRAQCDTAKTPIVFIHGFLASGDTWTGQIQRFIQSGYCGKWLFVFDWNSVGGNAKKTDSLLHAFILKALDSTGASRVDLVGHSAGGGLGRGYLLDSVRAVHVAHYIHLGSRKWFYEYNWFKNNRCLNIYSSADNVTGTGAGDVEGAVNLDLKDKDHYEVATSEETFKAMYAFLQGGAQPVFKNVKGTASYIEGKAVELGSNEALVNARVEFYITDKKSGKRKRAKPYQSFTTDENGNWGPFWADTLLHYEAVLIPAEPSARRISYFFEPFKIFNTQVYLRGFPQDNMIAMMLGSLPAKNDQSAIVVYSASKAMIAGRDSVTVNGIPVSSPGLTPAGKTIISSFIFDDGDGKTSGNGLKQFRATPFIGGVDVSLPVKKKKRNKLYYNGRKLVLPAVPSADRILLAVFH